MRSWLEMTDIHEFSMAGGEEEEEEVREVSRKVKVKGGDTEE